MADILSYISEFIPSQYGVFRYVLLSCICLLCLDVFFGIIIALFGKLFR